MRSSYTAQRAKAWSTLVSLPHTLTLNFFPSLFFISAFVPGATMSVFLVKLFDPTSSTTYYDVWCDRALIVTRLQCLLAASYAAALIADIPVPDTSNYSRRSTPDWEKGISVVPIFLAAINHPIELPISPWLCGFHHYEVQRILVFATSQMFQFLLCTLLTVHDFIRHGNAPSFWLSFVLWWLPAFVACAHGIVGLHATYLQYFPHVELNLFEPQLRYTDVEDDDEPLAQAFLQQETNRYSHEETPDSAIAASLDDEEVDTRHTVVSHGTDEDHHTTLSSGAKLLQRSYWQDSATVDTSDSSARFRWQDKLRNKAWVFWFPYAFANSLCLLAIQAMGFTARYTTYEGPWSEFMR